MCKRFKQTPTSCINEWNYNSSWKMKTSTLLEYIYNNLFWKQISHLINYWHVVFKKHQSAFKKKKFDESHSFNLAWISLRPLTTAPATPPTPAAQMVYMFFTKSCTERVLLTPVCHHWSQRLANLKTPSHYPLPHQSRRVEKGQIWSVCALCQFFHPCFDFSLPKS